MPIAPNSDLRSQLGPARDQGCRPTCVAFAFSDGHAILRGVREPLSVEHLYYHAVQRTIGQNPSEGVSMSNCMTALACDGQSLESYWPYLAEIPAFSAWAPPMTQSEVFRIQTSPLVNAMNGIIEQLNAKRPTIIALRLGERFYEPLADGRIVLGPGDSDTDYHAVLAVGHGFDGSELYILIRNSWGLEWGFDGHAWLSAAYLEQRIYSLAYFESREI